MSIAIHNIAPSAGLEQGALSQPESILSLDEQMLKAYSSSVVDSNQMTTQISALQQVQPTGDNLIKLQEAIANYHITASLNSTLCRKASSTVETLLRA